MEIHAQVFWEVTGQSKQLRGWVLAGVKHYGGVETHLGAYRAVS